MKSASLELDLSIWIQLIVDKSVKENSMQKENFDYWSNF